MQHDFSWSLRAYTHMGQRSEGGPKDPFVEGKECTFGPEHPGAP